MQMIEISKLKTHSRNNEFFDDISGDNWTQFLESIKTSGVIEPIIITQNHIIVSGHQRVRACIELGINEVPCEVKIYESDEQILKDLLETNLRQRGIGNTNPVKFARCIRELEKIYGIRNGSAGKRNLEGDNLRPNTQSELAEQLGIGERQLRDYKKLLTLIPELQDLVESDQLSPTIAYKVYSKLSLEEQSKMIEELGKDKIAEMTQKQTEQYILERENLLNENNKLKHQLHIEQTKKPQVVEVDNTDYSTINKLKSEIQISKNKIDLLEKDRSRLEERAKLLKEKSDLYEKDSKEYEELKRQMELLTQQKDDISRKINSATELSGLVVEIENLLKNKLAPIKYSRSLIDMRNDETVISNLSEILSCVMIWYEEMKHYLPNNKNIINVEVY